MVPEFKRRLKKHLIPCNCAACRFEYCRVYTYLNNCLVNSYNVTGVYLDLLFYLDWVSYRNCVTVLFQKKKIPLQQEIYTELQKSIQELQRRVVECA